MKPTLRFKTFNENWWPYPLSKLGTFIGGGTPDTTIDKYWHGTIPWLSSSNIFDDDIHSINVEKYINENSIKQSATKLIPTNSVLIVSRVGIGKFAVNSQDVCTSQDFTSLILNNSNSYFIGYLFHSKKKTFLRLSQGTSIKGFTSKEIRKAKFNIPSLPEQKKIADFLSTVDKKIQALNKKKELLQSYKKGLMQKIFPTKGRQEPEIRFKQDDGSNYPEWEEKKFEDIYQFASTNSLSRDKLNYSHGEIYNIHYGDIHTKFKSRFDLKSENVPFINSDINTSRYLELDYLVAGDLIIADASEDYNDIGKSIEVVDISGSKVLAGLHTFLAKLNSKDVVIGFMSHYVKCWNYRYQVMRIAQGTKVLSLSKSRMNKLVIKLPYKEEQTKIANFLTSIDDKIKVVSSQIDKMKEWKKGLLQQMFV